MMKRMMIGGLLILGGLLFQACPRPEPLPDKLYGRWDWYKTITPSHEITAQKAGYSEDINMGATDGYIVIFRNDTVYRRLYWDRYFNEVDNRKNTVLQKYSLNGQDGYLKFYLKFDQNNLVGEIEVSSFMSSYSEKADTVRSFYRRNGGLPRFK